jgi:hypothetical protein
MNISLVNTLVQVILSLPQEEQHLLQQQLAWQPRQSRRRRVHGVETGDSFDDCVAEIATTPCQEKHYLENDSTEPNPQPQIQSEYQPVPFKVRSVEARSRKSLSMFREFLLS